jgi:hypothetical protein
VVVGYVQYTHSQEREVYHDKHRGRITAKGHHQENGSRGLLPEGTRTNYDTIEQKELQRQMMLNRHMITLDQQMTREFTDNETFKVKSKQAYMLYPKYSNENIVPGVITTNLSFMINITNTVIFLASKHHMSLGGNGKKT